MFYGEMSVATACSPHDWHAHELLFGYVPAVVAGFLLTAVPNRTRRSPLQGLPLASSVLVWLAGRYAVTLSTSIGWLGATLVDCAFLVLMPAAVAHEIVAGRNRRMLKIVALLCFLAAGNPGFHLEAHLKIWPSTRRG